jgi:hypothetical protein
LPIMGRSPLPGQQRIAINYQFAVGHNLAKSDTAEQ